MAPLLSARQAAARCGLSEKTVRRWIVQERLAADKDGQGYLVDIEALAALAAARRRPDADSGHVAAASPQTGAAGVQLGCG